MKENIFKRVNKDKEPETEESNSLEKEEGKNKIKINYESKEYDVETYSYDFEYPEKIQKETGILGYKRCIIPQEEIFRIIKGNLEDLGINVKGLQDFESINKVTHEIYNKKMQEFGITDGIGSSEAREAVINWVKTREGRAIAYRVNQSDVFPVFDSFLSNGEFPRRTFNHIMGAYCDSQSEKMSDNFVKDKFFVQKIFDLDLAQKIKLGKRAVACDETEPIIFDVYKKDSDELIEGVSSHDLNKYREEIKDNKVYLIGNDAFNTTAADFWVKNSSVSVGFTINDKLFGSYIKKAYEIFLKNNFNTKRELEGIEQIIRMLAFCNDDFYRGYQSFFEDFDDLGVDPDEDPEYHLKRVALEKKEEKLNKDFVKIFNNFLPNISLEESHDEYLLKIIKNILEYDYFFLRYSAEGTAYASDRGDEICIPIFINHDEIPQISWGHAKYAHFYNKKGYNFFEFKHAEELPKPKDFKS